MLKNKIVSLGVITNLNGVIGNKENMIPWGVSADEIRSFIPYITDEIVLQGRKTYDALGGWPTASHNMVLSKSYDEDGCITVNSLAEAADYEGSHIYVFGGSETYKEALEYADEVYISIRKESKYNGEVRLPWLNEEKEYSVEEIVMSLFDRLSINSNWEILKSNPLYSEDGTKILRYKLIKSNSMDFCEKDSVKKIHEEALSLAKKSKEVGHLMKDCTALHHQYSMVVLGTNRLDATGFGFTCKDGVHYSVKYKQDENKNLYFSDLYILEFFDKPINGRMYSSTEICPFTKQVKCTYETKNSNKISPDGKLISRNFTGDKLTPSITEYINDHNFPENHYIIFFGYKDYGTTVEFTINGLSGFYDL